MNNDKKYEILRDDFIEYRPFTRMTETTVYRIVALKDFGDVKKGDLGGYIEHEGNLSHEGDCWIYGEAKVFDNAKVCDNARVFHKSNIYDNAIICGNAKVFGNSKVYGAAEILNNAEVFGNAEVCGGVTLMNYSEIYGDVKICGYGEIYDNAKLCGYMEIYCGNINKAKTAKNSELVDFSKILDEMESLYERKNKDYGNSFDSTVKKYGIQSALARIDDKLSRVNNLTKNKVQFVNESVEDSLIDLATYSVLLLKYLRNNQEV